MGNQQGKSKKNKLSNAAAAVDVNEIVPNEPIGQTLRDIPLLRNASDGDRALIGGALEEKKFLAGSYIFKQGDVGDGFYLITKGDVRIVIGESKDQQNEIAVLGAGDYFGEAALLGSAPRGAGALTQGGVTANFLSKPKFEALFASGRITGVKFANRRAAVTAEGKSSRNRNGFEEIKKPANAVTDKTPAQTALISQAVSTCLLFESLSRSVRARVVDLFYQQAVPANTSVIKQGEPGVNFYVVEHGNFEIVVTDSQSDNKKKVAEFGRGKHFGELALMYNAKRAATCTASQTSSVWILNRYDFRRLVQNAGEEKTRQYLALMQDIKLLAPLATYERQQLAEALEEVELKAGSTVFRQGEEGDAMYLVVHGETKVTQVKEGKEEDLIHVKDGDYFGERALLSGEPRAATVTCLTACNFLKLDRAAFTLLLGPLEDLLKARVGEYSGASGVVVPSSQTEIEPEEEKLDRSIRQEDLETVAVLGRGSFGFVTLVQHRQTKTAYALKAVSKAQIVETAQEEHIMSEKKVMASLHHPFFVNLVTTFNSRDELFFLLEPSMGGELFTTLRKHRFFAESTARFYAAHIVLGFECMHKKNYIYRDLKPENLLIGSDGYLKITDFGFAKKVANKTYTLCGTPEYLAPEIVSNKGHGKGVDWWCLGILIYEMLVSQTPFYHDDFMQMYAKIVRGKFKKESHLLKHAHDIISALLQVNPNKRLGVIRGGADLIKKHAWFNGFDWTKLLAKQLSAPIIPNIKNDFDVSNFDQVDEDHHVEPYIATDESNWDEGF